ncbi:nuclear valosin-containing protein-like [Apis mellifera]|uniref:Nuclear valosin-containing protein-like n=1 Tax=Apis mellifera TaxID=7460 RepID=A0A7M7R3M6_APIME|nr:nuclear valosin-containing protein-like [Apis mellifera]|eukprot:XP_392923.5 nuclear valosin-containing protein-like [Apis mellifera]
MQKVGKLNSSIDIIPLQGSSGDYKSKTMNNKHKIDSSHKFLRDKLLISRVQTYMHENENKVYIDVNEMADALQKKYKDYRIKKRGPFRALVRKAYDELTEMFAKKYCSREWPTYDDEDEEEEVDVESDPQNTMLDGMLLKMYKKSQNKQNGNSSDKELIDISSDDDVNKMESNSRKATEPEVVENLQQKPGPSSSTEKTTHAKEIEQLRRPSKEIQQTTTTSTTTTTTTTSTTIESAKKRQRDEDADCQFTFVRKTKGIPISDPKITFSDIRGNDKIKRIPISEPKITFSDIGGNDKVLKTVCKLLAHMKHPEIFKELGISPPRGFLLHGPPGCGKTLLAHAIAGELGIPLLKVAAPELVTGVSGESEARIRELFEQALAIAPCVIFLDEIDSVAPHRATAQREMERRIVAQLLSCLDELSLKENGTRVLVLGATNRPDSLDPALRRAGRFDHEVCLGIPDRDARAKILAVHTEKVALSPNVSLSTIASLTPGFVGADLVALIREAAMAAVDRILENLKSVPDNKSSEIPENNTVIEKKTENFENSGNLVDEVTIEPSTSDQNVPKSESSQTTLEMDVIQENSKSPDLTGLLTWLRNDPPLPTEQLSNLCIEHSDFETALRIIQPSAKREGFATVPDVTWDDVGSLRDIREELQMAILAPIRHSEHFTALGLTTPTGVLLCGPPGCGKTLLAKAIANEAGINFISVKGPELLNMYVGESEKAVRQCFIRARNSAPCVIFFDELDALCPRRSEGDNSATSRVVNQMLTEMDGVEGRQGVFLMAASNRPDIIDPAVLRPGRLDKILYVDLPTSADRVDILRALTKNATKPKLAADVNLEEIGYNSKCDGYTGADLAALIREAGIEALRELMDMHYSGQPEISMRHIVVAFDKIRPSVQEKDIKHYEKLKRLYSIKKKSDDTPMETPIDTPIVDVVMEPMET